MCAHGGLDADKSHVFLGVLDNFNGLEELHIFQALDGVNIEKS